MESFNIIPLAPQIIIIKIANKQAISLLLAPILKKFKKTLIFNVQYQISVVQQLFKNVVQQTKYSLEFYKEVI